MRLLRGNNILVGTVLTMFAEVYKQYGMVMLTFLVLNALDWITGTCKARFAGQESSVEGLRGICKKLGYWVLILVAFLIGKDLMIMGGSLGVNLGIADYIGWLTLGMLVVNEARSIIENLVELGVYVPEILIKGLEVAQDTLEEKGNQDSR